MSGTGWLVTTIDVTGASATDAVAIAPDGEIIGVATIGGKAEGFVYANGTATLLEVPGATSTTPAAINASGEIVGSFTNGAGTHGFIDNAGTFTTLDVPGAQSTTAIGINASGEVAGAYSGTNDFGVYLLSGGHYSTLSASQFPVTPVSSVVPEGVSDAGEVVGYVGVGEGTEGFSYANNAVSMINVSGSGGTYPTGINATGTIVGQFLESGGATVAGGFLDVGGSFTTFDVLGAGFNTLGITNSGTLYGSFSPTSGPLQTEGFIGTPGTFTEFSNATSISGIDSAGDLAGNFSGQALLFTAVPGAHWIAGSGNFNTAANWSTQRIPGAGDTVFIDAAGTYTVTAGTSETMDTLSVVGNATLVVSAGTFSVSGSSSCTGAIMTDAGAVLALAGVMTNAGTMAGAGQWGAGNFSLFNEGLVEATGAGGLSITSGTVSNAGTMLAANGSTLTLQSGVVNQNNSGGVLSWGTFEWKGAVAVGGGTWEADGNGSTLAVTGGAVTIDRASIVLSGAGSVFEAGDGSIFTNLQASLGTVAPIGTLDLEAGASFTATHGVAVFGTIALAGGTLTLPRLALGGGGRVLGFGAITDLRYPIFNTGTIEASGGTLALTTAIDPASSGVFQLDAASLLEIAADQGAGNKMSFVGGGGELIIDDAGKFGLNVGSAGYTGPLVQNFGTGDAILLKNVAPAGLTPVYDATTGILQISNGATNVASLAFANASLGTGTFHLGNDGLGHTVVTHA